MNMSKDEKLIPFLKWAGGKRWLINNYSDWFPTDYNRYIEPFLGAGSVYFHLKPKKAVINDLNGELITAYNGIKINWEGVQELLDVHSKNHCDEYYYQIREEIMVEPIEAAARFIYLNRTCFNGIYRVNLKGKFNVPKGSKNSVLLETDDFESVSKLLAGTELRISDFEPLINEAKEGDLIFADPPYTVRHNKNGFIKYNEKLFSWKDQERLAAALFRAKERGVKVLSTNANHQSVRELYEDKGFEIKTVSRYSSISASSKNRNQYEEIMVKANI